METPATTPGSSFAIVVRFADAVNANFAVVVAF